MVVEAVVAGCLAFAVVAAKAVLVAVAVAVAGVVVAVVAAVVVAAVVAEPRVVAVVEGFEIASIAEEVEPVAVAAALERVAAAVASLAVVVKVGVAVAAVVRNFGAVGDELLASWTVASLAVAEIQAAAELQSLDAASPDVVPLFASLVVAAAVALSSSILVTVAVVAAEAIPALPEGLVVEPWSAFLVAVAAAQDSTPGVVAVVEPLCALLAVTVVEA